MSNFLPKSGKRYSVQSVIDSKKKGHVYVQGAGFLGPGHFTVFVEDQDKKSLGLDHIPNKYIGVWARSWLWEEISF